MAHLQYKVRREHPEWAPGEELQQAGHREPGLALFSLGVSKNPSLGPFPFKPQLYPDSKTLVLKSDSNGSENYNHVF